MAGPSPAMTEPRMSSSVKSARPTEGHRSGRYTTRRKRPRPSASAAFRPGPEKNAFASAFDLSQKYSSVTGSAGVDASVSRRPKGYGHRRATPGPLDTGGVNYASRKAHGRPDRYCRSAHLDHGDLCRDRNHLLARHGR